MRAQKDTVDVVETREILVPMALTVSLELPVPPEALR